MTRKRSRQQPPRDEPERRATPTARILRGIRDERWSVPLAIAEFIDNSFGEQRGRAQSVWIVWNPSTRTLQIIDNGRGMENVAALFTLGEGTKSGRGDIGLYGIGGAKAGPWLSTREYVWTLNQHGHVAHMAADWDWCIEHLEFPVITDDWVPASAATCPTTLLETEHGTAIVLDIRQKIRILPDVIHEHLSRLFSVGLRQDRRITWITEKGRGERVETQLRDWTPGELADVIESTVTLANGLTARVRAGRADNLSIERSKLSVNYLYRQVKETTQGFGRPVQGAVGYIDLSEDWLETLTTTKDDIREECRDLEEELMAKVEEVLRPLINRLREAKRSKIFNNIKISLKRRFAHGFTAPVEVSRPHGGDGPATDPKPRDPNRQPSPRKRDVPAIAEIEIEEATDADLNGLLCSVLMDAATCVAFVNKDHTLVQTALESEPVNQRLLEQLIVGALAKEILQLPNGLVRSGLFTKQEADQLLERHNHDRLNIQQQLVRVLTDSIVDDDATGIV